MSKGTGYIENNLFYRLMLRQKLLSIDVTTVILAILVVVRRELFMVQMTVLTFLMTQHYFNI